jgi:hypothetical protein
MQIQQEQLAQLRAELEQRKRSLEEAQRDLNEAMEEYENEVGGAGADTGLTDGGCCSSSVDVETGEQQCTSRVKRRLVHGLPPPLPASELPACAGLTSPDLAVPVPCVVCLQDRKNRELGAENGRLQREVLTLTEHKHQLTEVCVGGTAFSRACACVQ